MTTHEQTSIIDLRTYAVRLLKQATRALPAAVIVMAIGLAWTFLVPASYESSAAVMVEVPAVETEAEATQQSALFSQLVEAHRDVVGESPEFAAKMAENHPDLDPTMLRETVSIRSAGSFLLLKFIASGETDEEVSELANDAAAAFVEVADELKESAPPPLKLDYRLASSADPELAEIQSGKLPRLIITMALTGLAWLLMAAVLDARAQRRAR